MRAHTITTTRPALLLSLLALGALGLVAFEGGGDEATATEATVSPETTITKASRHISIGSPYPKGSRPSGSLKRWKVGCPKPTHKKIATFEFTANQPGATFECAGVFAEGGAELLGANHSPRAHHPTG